MIRTLARWAALAFLVSFGNAQSAGYIGVSAGATSPDEDGFEDSNGYRITLGYDVSDNVAVEASYTDLGEFDADDDLVAFLELVAGTALDGASVEIDGIELGFNAHAPITDSVSIFGRAGVFLWDSKIAVDSVSSGSVSESDDGSDLYFGAGMGFDISRTVTLNIEYLIYDAADADIDYIGAGLAVKF